MSIIERFRRWREARHHERMAQINEKTLAEYPKSYSEFRSEIMSQVEYHREQARKLREEANRA